MTTRITLFLVFSVSAVLLAGCYTKRDDRSSLRVVPFVDLKRYAGEWHEIARLPNSFQKDCVGSKATYKLRDDGKITVLNQCHDKSWSGRLREAKGKAWVVDKKRTPNSRSLFSGLSLEITGLSNWARTMNTR